MVVPFSKLGSRPRIDLATVRETLALIHDDMTGAPDLDAVRAALADALAAIDAEGSLANKSPGPTLADHYGSRFEPWSPPR